MSIIQPPRPGTPTAPHIRRIMAEGDALAQNIAKINAFKEGEIFQGLPPLDKHLLTLQAEVMQSYLHILTIRLARANDAENGIIPDAATALAKKGTIIQ